MRRRGLAVLVGAALGLACGQKTGVPLEPLPEEGGEPEPVHALPADAGEPLDAGGDAGAAAQDAGFDGGADAGVDAGADAGFVFGTPGPWPVANVTYSSAQGILEQPVVGVSTDESQNLWIATHAALYLLAPGQSRARRFGSAEGLHLPDNPVAYCDRNFAGGDKSCPIYGAAASPGISELVGGGPGEVFVGYYGVDTGPGDWSDPNRHSGKLDRVRLRPDGTLQVDRFDLVANAHGAQYWHNRTVQRMVYDHFVHPHELYVGANHGVTRLLPDRFRPPRPGEWFDAANLEYMADHLHARVCFHAPCDDTESNQRMGDWRGLAIAPDGHLWHAGKWTAGKIRWVPDLPVWFSQGGAGFLAAFGDPYPLPDNGRGFINEPVFRVPQEGDPVHLSAVAVAADGRVWFASAPVGTDPAYGLAVWDGRRFTQVDPTSLGLPDRSVRDLVALPDGRLVLAHARAGLLLWDPATGTRTPLRAPFYLRDDLVQRLELDRMVDPPALHVSTWSGASVIRQLPP